MAGSKRSLVIDSPITCMQSTETTFAERLPIYTYIHTYTHTHTHTHTHIHTCMHACIHTYI